MKREQSRAGSRFAECEKSRLKAKILITLALLLTAVTGAWATTDPNSVYWYGSRETWNGWAESVTTHTVGDITITCSGNAKAYEGTGSGEPLVLQADANDAITFTSNGKPFASIKIQTGDEVNVAGWTWVSSEWTLEWSGEPTTSVTLSGCYILADVITFTFGTAEAPLTVEPVEGKTNEWTFSMPGSDVVLTPQYAPAAQLAENGAPAAVSGLEIAADAAIITAGQSAQGTLLYAVGTSETEKPALTAFSATLPNAKDQTAAGTYYVWYYIQGQDTPQGQEPSADNTFNDSEIMGPVMVELLTNEHTLNIKQSPNITVTVAGTAKTPTDDKVTPVTTGQEVKIKANTGYKFRKVEVKKGGAAAPAPAKPEYADNAEELPANTKLYMRADLVYVGDWIWIPTYTAEQAQAVADYYAAITGTKCAVIYGHGSGPEIYYVTSDNGVSGTITRSDNLTTKFPGYKVYLLK